MKKTLLSLLGLLCFMIMQAQVAKTVNMTQAGTLASVLTADEKSKITNLTLTGPIDAQDFKTMRDLMPVLAVLNIEETKIEEYSGSKGTASYSSIYPANKIPSNAFLYNYNGKKTLKTVKLPSGLTSIDDSAFRGCSGLTGELNLPAGLTSIGEAAFENCSGLTGIEFPASLTSIGKYAFWYCTGLTGELNFPAGLTFIGQSAFNKCSGLTGNLELPASLTSIGKYAFQSCSGLTGELNLSEELSSIPDCAFLYCSGLTSIHIKKNVKSIDYQAFSGCSNVRKITCETVAPSILGTDVFKGINTKTCELHVAKGSTAQYKNALQWKDFTNLKEIDTPTGIISPNKTIRTWKANGQLFVESTEEMMAAKVVDMSGRTACSISKTAYAYVLNLPAKGVYVVRIRTVNGEVKTMKVAM